MPSIGNYFSARTQRRTGVASSALNLIGTFLESEINNQYRNARAAALKDIAEWNAALQDPANTVGYDQWLASWRQHSEERKEQIAQAIKLPEAKQRFEADWAEFDAEQTEQVAALARGRQQQVNLSNLNQRMAEWVRLGEVEEIEDEYKSAVASGLLDAGASSTAISGIVGQAQYNRVYQELKSSMTDEQAMQALDAADATTKYKLTGDQIDAMQSSILSDIKTRDALAERQAEKQGLEQWDGFLEQLYSDEGMNIEQAKAYLKVVDRNHQGTVATYINTLETAIGKDLVAQKKLQQAVTASRLEAWITRWGVHGGEQPWTEDLITEGIETQQLNPEDHDRLVKALSDATKMRETEEDPQGRAAGTFRMRMFDAVEAGQNPAWAVTQLDLNHARDVKQITEDAYKELSNDRLQLQEKYESGAFKDKESTLMALYGKVYGDEDVTSVLAWIDNEVAVGRLRAETGNTWRGKVEPFKGNEYLRKSIFTPIEKAYNDLITEAAKVNKDKALTMGYEMAHALDAMQAFVRSHPDDPVAWEKERDRILLGKDDKQLKDAALDLRSVYKDVFGQTPTFAAEGIAGAGVVRTPYQDTVVAEALREAGRLPPAFEASFESVHGARLQSLDMDVLREADIKKLGTTINEEVLPATDPLFPGEHLYSKTAIKRTPEGAIIYGRGQYVVRYDTSQPEVRPYVVEFTGRGVRRKDGTVVPETVISWSYKGGGR